MPSRANARAAGGDRHRTGKERAAPAVGRRAGRGILPRSRAGARRHARRSEQRRPLAGGRAHPAGARPLHRRPHGLRRSRPPQARRVPARPVLRGAGDGHGHRSGPPHVRGAQRPGQAAGAQRHPEGGAAQRRAGRIGARRQGNLGQGRRSRRRALRAAFQPYPRHVSAARRQGDLRHQADRRREGRRVGVHRANPAAVGGHLRRHPQRPARRPSAVRQNRPVSALPRLAFVFRLAAAGHAVVAREGRGRGRARALPAPARSPGLRREDPGHRRLEARSPVRPGGCGHCRRQRPRRPGQSARADAPRAENHRVQPARSARAQRAGRQAPAAAPGRREGRQRRSPRRCPAT